jgi:hypothetical protein
MVRVATDRNDFAAKLKKMTRRISTIKVLPFSNVINN